MHVRRSVDIAAPPERIWPLMVEPDNVRRWYPTLRAYAYEDAGRRGPGAHIYAEEKASGVLMRLHFEVTDWVENRAISLHMVEGTGVKGYDQTWTLEPTPTGSRFTFEESVTLPYGVLGSVIGRIGQRGSEAHVAEMLSTVKALAEE
jgi:uncharacterized protein YndB with AHSA1/START domain